MNKASRHSKAHANMAVNRAHKRNALEIAAVATPCRDHRRAPLRLAHAAKVVAEAEALGLPQEAIDAALDPQS